MKKEFISLKEAKSLLETGLFQIREDEWYTGGGRRGFKLHIGYTLVYLKKNEEGVITEYQKGYLAKGTAEKLKELCNKFKLIKTPTTGIVIARKHWIAK